MSGAGHYALCTGQGFKAVDPPVGATPMVVGRQTLTMALVALLSVALAGVPAGAAASGEDPAPARAQQPERPPAQAERAALQRATSLVSARTGRSASAEYARAQAEAAVVETHRNRRAALDDLELVADLLDHARDVQYEALRDQREAQEQFDDGVALSYKFGGAQAGALVLAALESASDVHDLARAMDELDNVLGHSYLELGRRVRALAQAEDRVAALERLHQVAEDALEEASARIPDLEDAAQRARDTARAHELELLDALESELAAEEAVAEALERAAQEAAARAEEEAAEGTPAADGTAGEPAPAPASRGVVESPESDEEDEDEASPSQRREWLANRRAALARAASLPAEARWVKPDLVCPVEGATFTNDFHYPRSHGRRHEGTDVFADTGTPIRALAAGVVTKVDATDHFDGDHDLGGISVSFETDVGRFYAAHLHRLADGLTVGDEVTAGQVVGYVGRTGNARGTPPHLHLGWYVDDVAVNPWPSLALACGPED